MTTPKVVYQMVEQIEFWPSEQQRAPGHGKRILILACQHVIIRRASERRQQQKARCYTCEDLRRCA